MLCPEGLDRQRGVCSGLEPVDTLKLAILCFNVVWN